MANSDILKALMDRCGMDKEQVAEICCVSVPSVDVWRSNKPTDMPLGALKLLGYWLVYDAPDKPFKTRLGYERFVKKINGGELA